MKKHHSGAPGHSILFITQEFSDSYSGGAGVYARELVKAITDLNIEVHVMTMGRKNSVEHLASNFYIHTHKIINLPLLRVPTHHIQVYRKSKKIIKKYSINSIHSNNNAGAFSYRRAPLISTIHHLASDEMKHASFFQRLIYYPDVLFENITIKRSSTTIADSRMVERQLRASYPAKKVTMIPCGIDLNSFKRLPAIRLRKEMKMPMNEILFFFPGGARAKRKGALDLIMAFAEISNLKFKCIISGESRELGWKNELNSALEESGLKDRFIKVGEIEYSNLPKYYSCADIVAYPSLFEGFGLPVLEALACEKPIVCTRTGEAPYIIQDTKNGLLVDVHDVKALTHSLRQLITSTSARTKLARAGRKSVTTYGWDQVAKKIVELHSHAGEVSYANV